MVKTENAHYVYFEPKLSPDETPIVECPKCLKFDFERPPPGTITPGLDLKDLHAPEDLPYGP